MNNHSPGTPQPGIFAFGSPAHTYLEFDGVAGATAEQLLVSTLGVIDDLAAVRALNVVVGVRPELWRDFAADEVPEELHGFDEAVVGDDGFTMPATQHDVAVWIAASAYDVVFDASQELTSRIAGHARLASSVQGWHYHENHDLTGFVDGTENPTPARAPGLVLFDSGPCRGGSVLLLQQWRHDPRWRELPQAEQEAAIGRTLDTDKELDPRPEETSHVARTDQDDFGHILRRNTAFGTPADHGTMFVGFAARQQILESMLRSMAGAGCARDALTRYAVPLTGAYYYVPALPQIERLLPPED